ncbi:MAG: HU family DNA-binding protein [Marinilabiliaceae bacterium]|nr:HU family DNA-binding protein [Marinilabiliaceae bacterium]
MKYKLVQRSNPLNKTAEAKWYANAVNEGKISKTEISKEISGRSSLTRGDVSNVIENLIDELPKYLAMGKSVNLGDFGTFRLSLSSDGASSEKEFNAGMIRGAKVIFTPGKELKKVIENISFEKGE